MSKSFSTEKFKSLCAEKAARYLQTISDLKDSLKTNLKSNEHIDKCHAIVMAIAQNEAAYGVCKNYSEANSSHNKDNLLFFLLSDALKYNNDTWSGRANDFRRVQRDGEIEALRELKSVLEYYCEGNC